MSRAATSKRQSRKKDIHLNWSDKDKRVIIHPANHDIDIHTVEEVIEAVHAHGKEERVRVKRQFSDLLGRLGEWASMHAGRIQQAIVTLRDSDLLFLVVMNDVKYDPGFEDELTDLDIKIAQDSDYDRLRLSVLALPKMGKAGISSFIDTNFCLQYEGLDGD